MSYVPTEGSLADRVCTWFRRNQAEELTASDIVRKFEVAGTSAVHACLASCFTHHLLAKTRDEDNRIVIKAGPALLTTPAPAEAPPHQRSTAPTTARKRARMVDVLSSEAAEQLIIDDAIPFERPKPPSIDRSAGYRALHARMQPGQSVQIDLRHAKGMVTWARANAKGQKWSMRANSDGTARLWRLS